MLLLHISLFFLRLICPLRLNRELEILVLRQQLSVYRRQYKHPRLKNADRCFWIILRRLLPDWKKSLFVVQPETVIRWHRRGFAFYWQLRSRKTGRPKTNLETRRLIHKLSGENSGRGNERIPEELMLLGVHVSVNTIKKYRLKKPRPGASQSWKTFLKNQMCDTVSMDMFMVPTLTFGVLYGLVLISHARRKILHTSATFHPGGGWLGRQMQTLHQSGRLSGARYLIRDRDCNYGGNFKAILSGMGIQEVKTSPRSPWQNPYAERVIGSIRRECLDHMIVLNQNQLIRVLERYTDYYNNYRPHQGLGMECNSPIPRKIETEGNVFGLSHLNGLHHSYQRVA